MTTVFFSRREALLLAYGCDEGIWHAPGGAMVY
jgi:hypothetical protein